MNGATISIEILIAVTSGIVSALGVWFKLKSTVEMHKLMIDNIKHDCDIFNERVTKLKSTVEANREKNENSLSELKKEINDMEIRIIKAIHDIKLKK
jgi:gas vesicle protein